MADNISSDLKSGALFYHRYPRPGKLEIQPTKPLGNQRDLALAYSPGVAAACEAIVDDPAEAANLTSRQNLVAVISNGTAVLGLGDIGPLASKPVMEGKAVLFKKFSGIDVFDIEVAENNVDKLVEVIAALEPTFGGVNLEDIKAPECFEVEERLKARMGIPVFHDDQHGTAIIVGAAVTNALELAGKRIEDVKICTGRSDYPNQVNNVLCFPYIFRGALDVGATTINEEMKAAAVKAIASLAREAPSEVVARAYGGEAHPFGRNSLIPSPFDPRLILRIAPAVAKAAMDSGVATRPLEDLVAYADSLTRFVFRTGFIMKPLFTQAN